MQWKVLEFSGELDSNNIEVFGFKLIKCPPTVSELPDFGNEMANNIEFCNIMTFRKNSEMTSSCNKILVSANKPRNSYKLEKDQYEKLLKNYQ